VGGEGKGGKTMIGIGVQMGGPEQKDAPIKKALMSAMGIAERVRGPDFRGGDEAWVNPIFIVPGSLLKPEFEGYELGHFSKREKGLVVQIAVPDPVAKGEGIVEFIGESLREAMRLAASFFASKGISFSTLKAEKIILAIEAGLEGTSASAR
jgi:hypothetical protein